MKINLNKGHSNNRPVQKVVRLNCSPMGKCQLHEFADILLDNENLILGIYDFREGGSISTFLVKGKMVDLRRKCSEAAGLDSVEWIQERGPNHLLLKTVYPQRWVVRTQLGV